VRSNDFYITKKTAGYSYPKGMDTHNKIDDFDNSIFAIEVSCVNLPILASSLFLYALPHEFVGWEVAQKYAAFPFTLFAWLQIIAE
jgi:hypothetical protein